MNDEVDDDMSDEPRSSDAAIAERDIEQLLRELEADDFGAVASSEPPPPQVWAGIAAALADDDRGASSEPDAPVIDIRRSAAARRRPLRTFARSTRMLGAAAALIAVIVVGVTWLADRGSDSKQDEVVSSTVLQFDAGTFDPRGRDARGVAELVRRDGAFAIRLTDTALPEIAGEDLELWLIEPGADGTLVDIAPIGYVGGPGVYPVPTGLDPTSHYIVDISIEPRDGDTAHNGDSILRGALDL